MGGDTRSPPVTSRRVSAGGWLSLDVCVECVRARRRNALARTCACSRALVVTWRLHSTDVLCLKSAKRKTHCVPAYAEVARAVYECPHFYAARASV